MPISARFMFNLDKMLSHMYVLITMWDELSQEDQIKLSKNYPQLPSFDEVFHMFEDWKSKLEENDEG